MSNLVWGLHIARGAEVNSLLDLEPLIFAEIEDSYEKLADFDICPLWLLVLQDLGISTLLEGFYFFVYFKHNLSNLLIQKVLSPVFLVTLVEDFHFFLLGDNVLLSQLCPKVVGKVGISLLDPCVYSSPFSIFTHLAVRLNQTLGPEFCFYELSAFFTEVLLLDGQEVLVLQVDMKPLSEHDQGLTPVVLHGGLPCLVIELKFHLEGVAEAFSQPFPQLRADPGLDADSLVFA